MADKKKRIAIVGGGLAGAGCIATLKEEGHEPICFEATDKFGGTWCYREESTVGYASVMATTYAINSKEMSAMSNFPPPKEFCCYMRHKELLQYAQGYLKQNDGERHIRFNSEVTLVKKADDYDKTGRFLVTVKDKVTGELSTDIFDGVMIATGHFTYPKMVTFPGQENFKGTIMHTHSMKRAGMFKEKNVLIVGTGCSGLDAAEVISSVAKNVYISARSGSFVLSRQGPSGYPIDHVLLRRYITYLMAILPVSLTNWYIETFYMDTKFDHRFYCIQPKHHVLGKDPVLNDAIASKLLSGSVIQKGNVDYLTTDGVVFDGENSETPIDAIVLATGYDFKFPYLDEGLLEIKDGVINLYKCMYPTHLPHDTLTFICFINPFGPGIPLGEMQCRFAAHIVSGKAKLPSKQEMMKDVISRHQANEKRYAPSNLMSVRVDFVPYIDDLASDIGVKPKLMKYMFTDFPLFLRLIFGPCVSYQYRLEGPHKWDGARNAIMTTRERLEWPLVKNDNTKKSVLQIIFEFIGNAIPKNIFKF